VVSGPRRRGGPTWPLSPASLCASAFHFSLAGDEAGISAPEKLSLYWLSCFEV
jgi:hypothetical protein